MMHASFTAILVATVSLGFSQKRVVSGPNIVVAFPLRWLISASRAGCRPGCRRWWNQGKMDNIQFIAVDGNKR